VSRIERGADDTRADRWDGQLYSDNSTHHRAQDDAFLASFTLTPAAAYKLPALQRQKFREMAKRRAGDELRREDGTYDQGSVRMDVLAYAPW
jgi:hypothetical protein